ncbi:diguanylate cyclase [bacterium]|nr:diguanylate cyclase [bacterium]MBU1883510.1 diguanylate cyclase [bacterium]
MIYIFFVYGLSFFSFGLALLLYPKKIEGVKFVKYIWLVGSFGIIHGINEWVDMFKQIDGAHLYLLNQIGFVLLPLSYLCLLYFALVSLSIEKDKRNMHLHAASIAGIFVIVFIAVTLRYDDLFTAGNVWARYLLGIPGIFMSAYVLFMQREHVHKHLSRSAKKYLILLSLILAVYGILSGVIVPKAPIYPATVLNQEVFQEYFDLPVQLFRAICAVLAAFTVITSLKILRHELQTRLVKLSKAIEMSGDSVVITDKNGVIEYVNPAFEEETGYTSESVIGKKSSILKSGRHEMAFYQAFWNLILSGKVFRGYFINKKKNGEFFDEYKAIAPIMNAKGEITNFVSTGKDMTKKIRLEKELEQLASTDKLTGIANRMKFDEFMEHSFDLAQRYKINLSLILFDIDNFKKINDVYGHVAGDKVLRAIADIGRKNVRKSDLLARWGGEEFMIIEPNIKEKEETILAERLCQAIQEHEFEGVGKVTASFGVTTFRHSDTIDSLLIRVDDALYAAKTSGKNRVVQI